MPHAAFLHLNPRLNSWVAERLRKRVVTGGLVLREGQSSFEGGNHFRAYRPVLEFLVVERRPGQEHALFCGESKRNLPSVR
jgi:hypothetical protein